MSKLVKLKEKQTLFHEGELCENVGIVKSGETKISSYLLNGNEVIFNIIKEDELFGNNLIFSNSPYYRGNVVANFDSTVVLLSKSEFLNSLQTDQEFLENYLKKQSDFTMSLNFRIKLLSLDSAYDRLIYFLKYQNNCYTYRTITEFSSLLQLKRETLSRLLTKLSKNNEIIVKNKTVTLK